MSAENRKQETAPTEPTGSDSVDAVNEQARKVWGDAEVDYQAETGYTEPDEGLIQDIADETGDTITRNPDGTYNVTDESNAAN